MSETIADIVDSMKSDTMTYDEKALRIWGMLSNDEKTVLQSVITSRPPLWAGQMITDPVQVKLHEAKLINRIVYSGEEGYVGITFAGLAAFNLGTSKSANVTLPGESP